LRLFLTALLLKQFTGWDTTTAIIAMGAVTLLYTYLGGMQAVIWTDLIQFAVYIAGAIIAGGYILQLLPGGMGQFLEYGRIHSKFTLFDFNWDVRNAYTFWAGLLGGAFITMASHGADQLMVQRYLCARTMGQARFSLISSGILVFAQFLLFLLIGIGLAALAAANILNVGASTRKDEVFGLFITNHLPHGIIGLIIAAVLAAAMSTLSSSLNSSANAFVSDYYRPLRPNHLDSHYLAVAKILTALFGLAQISVALAADRLNSPSSLIEQVMTVAGFTTGPVLAVFLLGVWRPVAGSAALGGILCGFLTVLAVWIFGRMGYPVPAWPWFAPIGTLTTAAAAWLLDHFGQAHGSSHHRSA
jgi:SSS family transporter